MKLKSKSVWHDFRGAVIILGILFGFIALLAIAGILTG